MPLSDRKYLEMMLRPRPHHSSLLNRSLARGKFWMVTAGRLPMKWPISLCVRHRWSGGLVPRKPWPMMGILRIPSGKFFGLFEDT